MKYEFEKVRRDYSDFSSDRVLINAPKSPAFPVRVASEIMSRCLSKVDSSNGLSIYDPCCGGGHMLTVIGFLYNQYLNKMYGSDIDDKALEYAKRNFNLLTMDGLNERKESIKRRDKNEFQLEAMNSANRLTSMLLKNKSSVKDIQSFKWDITSSEPPLINGINIVITDLPYGNMVHWKGSNNYNPTQQMLNNIYQIVDINNSIICIICTKQQRIEHKWFEQVKRLKHGKRQIVFLRPSIL